MFESSLYNKLYNINQERLNKITAQNIRAGVNIFGTVGTYTSDSNAGALDILTGKTAYVNGNKITGVIKEFTNTSNALYVNQANLDSVNNCVNLTFLTDVNININGSNVKYSDSIIRNKANIGVPYNLLTRISNISSTDIKKDVRVFDIVGTYDASTEFEGIKMDPIVASTSATTLTSSISEISGLDTANGTNLFGFLSNLSRLVSVSNLDLTNISDAAFFFKGDSSLTTIASIDMYNASRINIRVNNMFEGCNSLTEIPNTFNFPTTVTGAQYMFTNCKSLHHINTPLNVISGYNRMFGDCWALQDLSNVNLTTPMTDWQDMSYMFLNCGQLDFNTVHLNNINAYQTQYMFANSNIHNASVIENIIDNMSNFSMGYYMFSNTNIDRPLNFENMSNIFSHGISNSQRYNSMQYTYDNCQNILQGDLNLQMFPILNSLQGVFMSCYNLTTSNIKLRDNTFMQFGATYSRCNNLQNVKIEANNCNLAIGAFVAGCVNIQEIELPMNNCNYQNISNAFGGCTNLTTINNLNYILNSPTLITVGNAFNNCPNLYYDGDVLLNAQSGYIENVFTNCYNMNIHNFNFDVNYSSYMYNFTNIIKNTPVENVSININAAVYARSSKFWLGDLVINCNKMTDFSLNVNYRSTNGHGSMTPYIGISSIVYNCPNLVNASVNVYMNNDSMHGYGINYCPNLTNLNVDYTFTNITTNGASASSYVSYMVQNCNNLQGYNFNLDVNSQLTYFCLGMNCSNLRRVNANITAGSSGRINSIYFMYCPNLEDSFIDDFLGYIDNSSWYYGNKKFTSIFTNCNISNTRFEQLNNYSNLIANGWTIN